MRATRYVLLLILVTLAAPSWALDDPRLAAAGADYAAAIRADNALGEDSARAASSWRIAEAAAEAGDWTQAVEQYERAVAFGADDPKLWLALSRALATGNAPDWDKAHAAAYNAHAAAKSARDRAFALFRVAELYETRRQPVSAMEAYGEGLELVDYEPARERWEALRDEHTLRVTGAYAEPESETPRICIELSHELAGRQVRYGDYVRIEPAGDVALSTQGAVLCAAGVEHGRSYDVTVLKGLPDIRGVRTDVTERFDLAVPDRKPSLAFDGQALILPRGGDRMLSLSAVNVERASIRILRIDDRNLVHAINDGRVSGLLAGYDIERIEEETGELIWEGSMAIGGEANRTVAAGVPVGKVLGDPEPGVYIVTAAREGDEGRRWQNRATQWMIVTDVGLTAFSGTGGLQVFVRSLETARPMTGAEVRLVARNNEVLATTRTGALGMAGFDPGLMRGTGGAAPAAVMALGANGDFSFLDLTQPAFDLSDRGVAGRPAAGPVDAFVFPERGAYRPGETVHLTALVRDDAGAALADVPLILKIVRPDGTEQERLMLRGEDAAGMRSTALPLSPAARTGRWRVQAHVDPDGPAVGSATFQVEDFVPERMSVALESDAERIAPGEVATVAVRADFLYGAPGAHLDVETEIALRQDMNPHPALKGYRFGLVQEEWRPRLLSLPVSTTGADGAADIPVSIEGTPDTTRPLEAVVRVSVLEQGGRAVTRSLRLPVRFRPFEIGIDPAFDERVEENAPARFDVAAVAPDGSFADAPELSWELYEEEYRYNWFERGGEWSYTVTVQDTTVRSGTVAPAAEGPEALSFQLPWGRYRLEVYDEETGAATSVRFSSGWYTTAAAPTVPDKLELGLDKDAYGAGETARVFVKPPFDGPVLLTVASDSVHMARVVDVPAEGKAVPLTVEDGWGAGAYVIATAFRPAGASEHARGPGRAIGLSWLGIDRSARTLDVAIDAPETIRPRQTVEVGVQVAGAGDSAHVVLAAVDEGILQLTNYATPDPAGFYFGKRRLGVDLRDDYGRLIRTDEELVAGTLRQGGDAAGDRHLGGLDASSIRTVALFSGPVALDAQGRAAIPLDIPDFNGRLRLMAVAADPRAVGAGEAAMTVRDPVVSVVTLPRFLAPEDRARMSVSLHNVDGPAGDYTVRLDTTGAVAAGGAGVETVSLDADARADLAFELAGAAVGTGTVSVTLEGPELSITRSWDLAVRAAQPVQTREIVERLQPGDASTLAADLAAGYVEGTASVTLGVSPQPDLNVAGLLEALDRYPYGCVEQTTSRALPLLYVGHVARSIGLAEDQDVIKARVQGAVRRVLSMQASNGSFGMWGTLDNREDWLTAYALDFLHRAKAAGYLVPGFAHGRGLDWLEGSVTHLNFDVSELPARAYAFYVLAQTGRAEMADLRYVHDVYLADIPTPLARAQLGAALAIAGDRKRAESAFAAAAELKRPGRRRWGEYRHYWDYGSELRDQSALAYLASATGNGGDNLAGWIEEVAALQRQREYTSTQENAWMLLLANEVLEDVEPMRLVLDGEDVGATDGPMFLRLGPDALAGAGFEVRNAGERAVWQTVSVSGVPAGELPAARNGMVVRRAFYRMDGTRADLESVGQGEMLVAVISGEAVDGREHPALVVDLLPSGFEIENARLTETAEVEDLGWLPELSAARHVEPRDDRFVAAVDLDERRNAFVFAYFVRAVTPGTFVVPAPYVEDMYEPATFGRAETSRVTIAPRG